MMRKKEEASDRQNKQGSKREIAHACQEKLTDYMKALTHFTEVLSAQVQAAARRSDETPNGDSCSSKTRWLGKGQSSQEKVARP